jgi:Right handed beta helix region
MIMKNNSLLRASASVVLLALFSIAGRARAADVTVGCPGGSGGTYPTINAALTAIGLTGPSTITVTGTCTEYVALTNARSLAILGSAGAKLVALQDFDAIDISLSQDITIAGLEIVGVPGSVAGGGGAGVYAYDGSEVHILSCNIHDNEGGGVVADTKTQLFLHGTTVHNNTPNDGLDVLNNSSADVFGTTIQNNGLPVTGGVGILVNDRSSLVLRQANSILNNGDYGILATVLSSVHIQSAVVGNFSTISGHGVDGIAVARDSSLQINGASPQVVTANGSSCPLDPTCGGVYALRNSVVNLGNASITGNHGSGVNVDQGSNLVLNSATLSNNSGDGVHVEEIAIGNINLGNTITGNGGASVFCDSRSLVLGDLSAFSKVKCAQSQGGGKPEHGEHERAGRVWNN